MAKRFIFDINMSYAECQNLYAQQILYVIVHAHTGERVQLPKENIRRFLLPNGINGRFEMRVDAQNKILSIERYAQ